MSLLREKVEDDSDREEGFVLTEGDILVLRMIHEHRFLRRGQIGLLSGRHAKRIHRRLFKLVERGYLSVIRLPQQQYIYAIGREALPILVEQGISEPEIMAQRLRTHELKELFLKHEMMIVDVHVAMSLASRDGDVKLIRWEEGKALYDSVVAVDSRGSNQLPVRPDAFLSLEDSQRPEGTNRAHFALEADRSTTTQARFEEKVRAYWSYIEQGRHVRKFGIKGLRVLTVTVTAERARNLCALAASVVPEKGRKHFLFAPLKELVDGGSRAIPREPKCYSARTALSHELHPLLPVRASCRHDVLC